MAESLLVLSSVAMMRQPVRWLGGTDILILGPGRRQPRVAERYFSGEPQESKLLSAIRLIITGEDASLPLRWGVRDPGAKLVHPRDLGAEVLRLPDRADLEVARTRHRVGAPLGPLDRLFDRPNLPDPEPRHQLLRLGEGSVGHRPLGPIEVDPLSELARLEPVSDEHDPCLDQLLVELSHLREHLFGLFNLEGI